MEARSPGTLGDEVTLEIPPHAAYVRVARLVASGVGTFAGMDIDDIDDLRIAVDELCAIALDGASDGPLALRFHARPDAVSVGGRVASHWPDGPVPDSERWLISEQILDVVTDERSVRVEAGVLTFSMVKRRRDE